MVNQFKQLAMKKTFLPLLLLSCLSFGQVGVNTESPEATLDIVAQNSDGSGPITTPEGVLVPRLSRLRAQNMLGVKESTLIYVNDITNGSLSGKTELVDAIGFYYYSESTNRWVKLSSGSTISPTNKIGDIKYSYSVSDHDGWFLLNGRNISTLTTSQQAVSQQLGFTANLPDARGNLLKMSSTGIALGAVGGNNTVNIAQANLPNITFTGTTNTTGSHTHSYVDRGNTSFNVGSSGNNYTPIADDTSSTYTTGSSGNHSHTVTVSSGGSGTSLNVENKYINVNIFIYLGS